MEIYKLSDKISDKPRRNVGNDYEGYSSLSPLKITEMKQGVKNPNRVNVFVNGEFSFSLDVTQIVDFKLKIGLEISEEQLIEYKKASEFGKLYQRALEKALTRPCSEKEIRDYLVRKLRRSSMDIPTFVEDISELSDKIVQRLIDKGYVDDRRFAEYYVENRFVKKGVSQKRLRMELMKKGVSKEIIEGVLGGRNDEEEIYKMIAKKRGKYDDKKLIGYLCRQGFSYDLVKEAVERGD